MAAAYASAMTSSFFTAHFPPLLEPYLSTSPFFCKFFIIDWICFLVSTNSSISFVFVIAGSSCIRCSIPVFISAPFFGSFLRLLFGSFSAPFRSSSGLSSILNSVCFAYAISFGIPAASRLLSSTSNTMRPPSPLEKQLLFSCILEGIDIAALRIRSGKAYSTSFGKKHIR